MKISIKTLHEIYLECSHFLKKVYPDFVTSRRPDRFQGVPVFTFHTIMPHIFEEQLEFLKENQYITIGADDMYNYLTGKSIIPERSVLLTIDDGRKSVWTYGFPLLKKFGFHATVFVIPGHTKNSGLRTQDSRLKDESADEEILSWQEILIMKDSGLIDFGSHTLYHHKIFTGPDIVDFLGPESERRSYSHPAVPAGFEGLIFEKDPSDFFGMPIYTNDSLMSGKPRFIDDQEFRDKCIEYYKTIDPRLKTENNRWKKEMFRFSIEYENKSNIPKRFSAIEDIEKEIYGSLYTSKKILEERLETAVNHLCYPFGIWSNISIEMAKKAGYRSSFCAYIPHRQINKSGNDPYKIVRLKDDYIFRLPGKGRRSLAEIILYKFKRRLSGEKVY